MADKIEHRMFCFISKNGRGKPLVSSDRINIRHNHIERLKN
jgi:hypothetical protein